MSGIAQKFGELRTKNEGALIVYITGGDPSVATCKKILRTVEKHADIVEVGIPFSDPIADGPVIQSASERALRAGMTPDKAFAIIKNFRSYSDKPLVVLTYCNIVLQRGLMRFMKEFADAGGDGLIVADLPVEECSDIRKAAKAHGIDLILLAAPTSSVERVKKISNASSGFIYLVSLLGVTGTRKKLSANLKESVNRMQLGSTQFLDAETSRLGPTQRKTPIAVGFGISTPEHVAEVIKFGADGAIVGSAVVRIIQENLEDDGMMLKKIGALLKRMKARTKKSF
jgi:tryptophan synthase alpha chain